MQKRIDKNTSLQIVIETPLLFVKGNTMSWRETMILLSNVSCISAEPLAPKIFPKLSIDFLLIGLLFSLLRSGGFIFLAIGLAWIFIWCITNEKRKEITVLNIVMNSGSNLQFVVNNRDFLEKVLNVLEQIIIDGGVGKQYVAIDIQGCKITGNAEVLKDLNIS